MSVKSQVVLPGELMEKAEDRARALGLSVAEYVQSLVADDVASTVDAWRHHLPWKVEKQYLLDEIEFYEAEQNAPQQAAHSAEELMELLDEETK